MELFDSWVNACEEKGYLSSVSKDNGIYTLIGNGKMLNITSRSFGKNREVMVWSTGDPTKLRKVVGSGVEQVLPRLVVQHFTGIGSGKFIGSDGKKVVYSGVGIFPSKVVGGKVIFSDHAGREWVLSGQCSPNVTLEFYKVLYDGRADMSALLLPQLQRRDNVKIGSSVSSGLDTIITSAAELEDFLPNCRERMLLPRSEYVPSYGVAEVSGLLVSSADRESLRNADYSLHSFMGGHGDGSLVSSGCRVVKLSGPYSFISSASDFVFKMSESGMFRLDCGQVLSNGVKVYSRFTGNCSMVPLLEAAKAGGYSYVDLLSGVNLSGSSVADSFKKIITSTAHNISEVREAGINRKVCRWVISGRDLDAELRKWGLNNPGHIFQSVSVLGVDLDGTAHWKGVSQQRPVMSNVQRIWSRGNASSKAERIQSARQRIRSLARRINSGASSMGGHASSKEQRIQSARQRIRSMAQRIPSSM
jgi:hypothetical protein